MTYYGRLVISFNILRDDVIQKSERFREAIDIAWYNYASNPSAKLNTDNVAHRDKLKHGIAVLDITQYKRLEDKIVLAIKACKRLDRTLESFQGQEAEACNEALNRFCAEVEEGSAQASEVLIHFNVYFAEDCCFDELAGQMGLAEGWDDYVLRKQAEGKWEGNQATRLNECILSD